MLPEILGPLAAATFITVFIVYLIAFILLIVYLVGTWSLYKKCGQNGWEAIIPFYAKWIKMVKIAKLNWWWFLIAILSSFFLTSIKELTLVFWIIILITNFQCNYNIAKKFHKGTGLAILMTLFPIILYFIIAFSKEYVYDDSVLVSKNGIIKDSNVNTNNNANTKQ